MIHYDDLETRSADERAASLAECLPAQVGAAKALPGYRVAFDGFDPAEITTREALAWLPVLLVYGTLEAIRTPGLLLRRETL